MTRAPARRGTIPPAVETPSRCGFQALRKEGWPIPCCDACGVQLNVCWGEGEPERDPWHVNDRVLAGDRPKIGSAYRCRVCVEDPGLEAARIRRVRKLKRGSNYVE